MATITFRAKAHAVESPDGSTAYIMIDVPTFKRSHCDMDAFRRHARYGGLANSDLFQNALARIRRDMAPAGFIRTDRLPANVSVDLSGFLALVTIDA